MDRILLVKTSSLGDIVHNLPVASDIRQRFPGVAIDWVAEEAFCAIPRLHPAVDRIIPVALRRWRKAPFSPQVRQEWAAFRQALRAQAYDVVIDTQGLFKSALLTWQARGLRCGYDWRSAWEPLATLLYQRRFRVSPSWHAVERNRSLAGKALGYTPAPAVDYGIAAEPLRASWLAPRYAVMLHGTSRDDKAWPQVRWAELGRELAERGVVGILPAGSNAERARSEAIAAQVPGAVVPPSLDLTSVARLLAGAEVVVGVDTGLTHLAAALGRPVVGLYCATEPEETGVFGSRRAVNLGSTGKPPTVQAVWEALRGVA